MLKTLTKFLNNFIRNIKLFLTLYLKFWLIIIVKTQMIQKVYRSYSYVIFVFFY